MEECRRKDDKELVRETTSRQKYQGVQNIVVPMQQDWDVRFPKYRKESYEIARIFQDWMLMSRLCHHKEESRNWRGRGRVLFHACWAQTGKRLQQNIKGNAHHHRCKAFPRGKHELRNGLCTWQYVRADQQGSLNNPCRPTQHQAAVQHQLHAES